MKLENFEIWHCRSNLKPVDGATVDKTRKLAKPVSEVHETFSFDIDSYLQGTILRSQIAFEDWITQTLHVIRRDANGFLGG